jgi:hypothetical protein
MVTGNCSPVEIPSGTVTMKAGGLLLAILRTPDEFFRLALPGNSDEDCGVRGSEGKEEEPPVPLDVLFSTL